MLIYEHYFVVVGHKMQAISLIPFVVGVFNLESCWNSSKTWEHGAEYIFKIELKNSFDTPNVTNLSEVNAKFTLKCRPFSVSSVADDGLQCYVNKSESLSYPRVEAPQLVRESQVNSLKIENHKFEIVYSKKGINQLRLESMLLKPLALNAIRLIASHLNFGFDRFDKGGERFAVLEVVGQENSTLGECETKFEVSKQMINTGYHWNTLCGDELHLETYAYGSKNSMITMDKTRDMEKCSESRGYFFSADLLTICSCVEVESSVTSFSVEPHHFGSRSKNRFVIIDHNNETSAVDEEITLRLSSIEPAATPFKLIQDPSVTTIFADDPVIKNLKG